MPPQVTSVPLLSNPRINIFPTAAFLSVRGIGVFVAVCVGVLVIVDVAVIVFVTVRVAVFERVLVGVFVSVGVLDAVRV